MVDVQGCTRPYNVPQGCWYYVNVPKSDNFFPRFLMDEVATCHVYYHFVFFPPCPQRPFASPTTPRPPHPLVAGCKHLATPEKVSQSPLAAPSPLPQSSSLLSQASSLRLKFQVKSSASSPPPPQVLRPKLQALRITLPRLTPPSQSIQARSRSGGLSRALVATYLCL